MLPDNGLHPFASKASSAFVLENYFRFHNQGLFAITLAHSLSTLITFASYVLSELKTITENSKLTFLTAVSQI